MYDIYTVQNDDTLESIANKYNITPYILYQLNGFNSNYKITPGNKIVVPKVSSLYFDYYTIKKGDNLFKIANKYGVNSDLLALINGLEKEDYIYPNQVISVPKNGIKYYIVKNNDSLLDVVNNLNANVNDLLNQNNEILLLPEQLIVYKSN